MSDFYRISNYYISNIKFKNFDSFITDTILNLKHLCNVFWMNIFGPQNYLLFPPTSLVKNHIHTFFLHFSLCFRLHKKKKNLVCFITKSNVNDNTLKTATEFQKNVWITDKYLHNILTQYLELLLHACSTSMKFWTYI